jgi:hypothetical protein
MWHRCGCGGGLRPARGGAEGCWRGLRADGVRAGRIGSAVRMGPAWCVPPYVAAVTEHRQRHASRSGRPVTVADPGCSVIPVHWGTPDLPRNPDRPRCSRLIGDKGDKGDKAYPREHAPRRHAASRARKSGGLRIPSLIRPRLPGSGQAGASRLATWRNSGEPVDSCTLRANSHSRTRRLSSPVSPAIRSASPEGSAASLSSQLSMCCSTS